MSTLAASESPSLPWAEQFFAGAIQSRRLAHAYVLKGKAFGAMYQLALQVAQVLNCQNRPSMADAGASLEQLACGQCTHCKWIAGNSHPAVLTVSRLTYQVNAKGELMSPEELDRQKSAATQIKTDQIGRLIQQLGVSSEAVRVVIFTDAEELPASIASDVVAPFDWRSAKANEEKSFHIRPLTRDIFNVFSVNRFLKTLEEPPQKTLFFFIAETEEQLLETIVSRCQVVPCAASGASVPGLQPPDEIIAFTSHLLKRLQQGQDAYALAAEFENFFANEAGLSASQGLAGMQAVLRVQFLPQLSNDACFATYRQLQALLEDALEKLHAKTNENQVILNLLMKLSRQLNGLEIF
jgi:hypothetical protein